MDEIIEWVVDILGELLEASLNDAMVKQRISRWVRSAAFGAVWLLVQVFLCFLLAGPAGYAPKWMLALVALGWVVFGVWGFFHIWKKD